MESIHKGDDEDDLSMENFDEGHFERLEFQAQIMSQQKGSNLSGQHHVSNITSNISKNSVYAGGLGQDN